MGFTKGVFDNANFSAQTLSADFQQSSFKNANFSMSDGRYLTFSFSDLDGANFNNADLSYALILCANVSDRTDFTQANLQGAFFMGTKTADGSKMTQQWLIDKGAPSAMFAVTSLEDAVALIKEKHINLTIAEHYMQGIDAVCLKLATIKDAFEKKYKLDTHDEAILSYCTPEIIGTLKRAKTLIRLYHSQTLIAHQSGVKEQPGAGVRIKPMFISAARNLGNIFDPSFMRFKKDK